MRSAEWELAQATVSEATRRVVELVRFPRMIVSVFIGAGLALSGATLQGIFRNPLVDQHVLGVSSGAAFGGAVAILFGLSSTALFGLSFGLGLGAVLLVMLLSRESGRSPVKSGPNWSWLAF